MTKPIAVVGDAEILDIGDEGLGLAHLSVMVLTRVPSSRFTQR